MKALELSAETHKSRVPSIWYHPAELAILVTIAALYHFAARQSWPVAFANGALLFYFLPRGQIYPSYNSKPQWTWLLLRWVTLGEVLLLFFATLDLYRDGDNWLVVVSRTLIVLFLARLFAALADIGEINYPLDARGARIVNCISGLILLALLAPFLLSTDWHAVAQWRPNFESARNYRTDWRSLAPIGIGIVIFILFVWPPLELWNRVVKPLDKRADLTTWQRCCVAVAALVACGMWWVLLVFLLFWIGSQPNFAS